MQLHITFVLSSKIEKGSDTRASCSLIGVKEFTMSLDSTTNVIGCLIRYSSSESVVPGAPLGKGSGGYIPYPQIEKCL